MINSLKSFTTAAALVIGLGAASVGSAQAQNAAATPTDDRYHPSFNDTFNVAACTTDNHKAEATLVTFQSVTDWQRLASGNPQGFQAAFNNKVQPILDKTWQDIISKHSSDQFNNGDKSFVDNAVSELKDAATEIENLTGISVIIRGGPSGPTSPGCS